MIKEIGTSKVLSLLNNPEAVLLDVRPIAAYNGWKLYDENRGGHISGAKSLPLRWLQYMDWIEVLDEKNIVPDKPLVVYGYEIDDALKMGKELVKLGYDQVFVYHKFLEEWSARNSLPMERLANYRKLVYPEWVKQLINGENPPGFDGHDFVICHSHYGFIEDYHKGHIPGAVALDTNSLESTETWNRRSPEELKQALLKLGIRVDTTVVVYGRFSAPMYTEEKFPGKSAGHLGALRCAAIMLYAGVKDVKVLNGGMTRWEDENMECTTESETPVPADHFGAEIPVHPEYMVDLPEAKELLASDVGELVSIRSWKEFIGEESGYHYIEHKGRISGAVFGNCGTDAYHMENYRNFDHTMREYREVAENWREAGITPDKHIAFYCGTGWRGSEAFINAYLMDWPTISIYDGGWYEWCTNPENPVEIGSDVEPVIESKE